MTRDHDSRTTRRRVLSVSATALAAGLAGCMGGGAGSGGQPTTTDSEMGTTGSKSGSGTTVESLLGGHPSAVGLADQPRLGPPPSEAEGVIVAFEDPSCTRCAAFEKNTVPKIRENLGDSVSFVLRTYPIVYPWGKPATQAVEATFAHEMEAGGSGSGGSGEAGGSSGSDTDAPGSRQGSVGTWALVDHYFAKQSAFTTDNVFEKTREFLAGETDLDADAIVSDAESKADDDAVQADLAAGEEAGVNLTPTLYLFKDGEYRTSAKGSISYSVVKSTLGL